MSWIANGGLPRCAIALSLSHPLSRTGTHARTEAFLVDVTTAMPFCPGQPKRLLCHVQEPLGLEQRLTNVSFFLDLQHVCSCTPTFPHVHGMLGILPGLVLSVCDAAGCQESKGSAVGKWDGALILRAAIKFTAELNCFCWTQH